MGTRGSWDDAYQWALGKEVKLSTTGEKMKNQAMAMEALGYLEKSIVDDTLIKMIDDAFNMNATDPDQN